MKIIHTADLHLVQVIYQNYDSADFWPDVQN